MREPTKKYTKVGVEFIIRFYELMCANESLQNAAHMLDIPLAKLKRRIEKLPSMRTAMKMAQERVINASNIQGYVFRNLSPEAREAWEHIDFWEKSDDPSRQGRVQEFLTDKPEKLRKELFIHSMVSCNWNMSEACRMSGISKTTLDNWRKNDEFENLIQELVFHKKNFYQGALDNLVAKGNASAVMFVNRTVNADRGYNEKLLVEHTATQTGRGNQVDIDSLDLSIEVRRAILDAVRRKREAAAFANAKPILEISNSGDAG